MSVKGWSWDSKPRSPALEAVASLTTWHPKVWAMQQHARKDRPVHPSPEFRVREQGLQSWSEPVFPYPKVPGHILSGGYMNTFNFRNDYAEKEGYYRG